MSSSIDKGRVCRRDTFNLVSPGKVPCLRRRYGPCVGPPTVGVSGGTGPSKHMLLTYRPVRPGPQETPTRRSPLMTPDLPKEGVDVSVPGLTGNRF